MNFESMHHHFVIRAAACLLCGSLLFYVFVCDDGGDTLPHRRQLRELHARLLTHAQHG